MTAGREDIMSFYRDGAAVAHSISQQHERLKQRYQSTVQAHDRALRRVAELEAQVESYQNRDPELMTESPIQADYNMMLDRVIALELELVSVRAERDRYRTLNAERRQTITKYRNERVTLAALLESWYRSGWRTMTTVETVIATGSWLDEYNSNEAPLAKASSASR